MSDNRLFVKIKRSNLPQVKDKYPFIYLERGRLEIDDSSIKWIDCDGEIIRIPVATINAILLGPGTTVTHEAIKVVASSNCLISWVGEDSLLYYATGIQPNSDSRNFQKQVRLAGDKKKSLEVARRMFHYRFPDAELEGKTLKEMMGMEGYRVRNTYIQKAEQYGVGWKGRDFIPGKFEFSDMTNRILTSANAALYGILCSVVHSLGYTPYLGFIHSGSPLPFVYDLADLYKHHLCIDLAFALTLRMAGEYNKHTLLSEFRSRVIDMDLMSQIPKDINNIFEINDVSSNSK